ncbi:glutathione S-transferase T3-like [Eutrema salsugineum]|uniref:glutathione S-transferase T3-like n=1 Tax=Eutrema salsugineum TaxID=72664 RepID=UPI000CED59FB|nr:glutathione S-transferase T3-like [Eutrema salsugineum]
MFASLNLGEMLAQRGDRRTWAPNEDVLLISAWLNTSKDHVVANEQKSGAFWKKIAAYYVANLKPSESAPRKAGQCKQRCHKINDVVCKFCRALETATREETSGMNENNVIKLDYEIYFSDQKKRFNLEHAWKELRNDQKWSELSTTKTDANSKKRTEEVSLSQSSIVEEIRSDEQGQGSNRPPGVKAAKAKCKKIMAKRKALCEFEGMWAIKEKEMAIKERLSNMALIDSLIAEIEPLAQYEETLKKKLIQHLFSD